MISNRYSLANNKYMGNKYNKNETTKYIIYLDANNSYEWAMSKPLPTGGFKWMNEKELTNWRNMTCILEVDLAYPKDLHDLQNDYPLAPEIIEKNKVNKSIPNLSIKVKYVSHYKTLKLYEKLGLKTTNIHRGI